ncbi:MAG: hypothetical protein CME06_02985 [Gemmatimonadetes bacterium]|nr:hypothetical protein [Gemmatimonadota bacterium]
MERRLGVQLTGDGRLSLVPGKVYPPAMFEADTETDTKPHARTSAFAVSVAWLAAGTAFAAGAQLPDSSAVLELPSLGAPDYTVEELLKLLVRLVFAAAIGAVLAFHPLRRRSNGSGKRARRMVQTQVILTVAAALMVLVINDSFERAMGLVGLGSFIRFRNVVSNPVETALIFVHIGLGMACGLGQFALAGVSTAAFVLLLIPILLWGSRTPEDDAGEDKLAGPTLTLKARGSDAQALTAGIEDSVEESTHAVLLFLRERRDDGRVQARVRLGPGESVELWIRELRARIDPHAVDIQWSLDDGEA